MMRAAALSLAAFWAMGMLCFSVALAAPAIEPVQVSAPVTVADNGATWTLDNGIVKATINKSNGNMTSLRYHGMETMGGNGGPVDGGYWEETPQGAPRHSDTITIDPTTNGGERGEVAIKGETNGTYMLTPNAPGGGTYCNIELRYALGRGDSGIYAYGIFSHPASYGVMGINESRYVVKLTTRSFDWLSVDADRNMIMCTDEDLNKGVVVHAKEQRILSSGLYKNSVEHKYSYTAIQYKVPAFGWSSTGSHVGVWFINPTIEYLSGGASKQELVCHKGATILDYWRGTHYNGGASCNINAGEQWSKVIGPIFVYCNALSAWETPSKGDMDTLTATAGDPTLPPAWHDNAIALWQDALQQAKVEKAKWPYAWVNGVDYPHKEDRGTVSGRIVLDDPQASTSALPHLMVGLAHADYPRGSGGPGFGGGRGGRGAFSRGGATTNPAFARSGATTNPAFARAGFGAGRFLGNNLNIDWMHDAKFYQFWNDGDEDGNFTLTNVRPGTYTLHAFADGVLGELAVANITVAPGQTLNLGDIQWKPVRDGKQVWEIGYPDRTGGKFFKGDGADYWLWGWCLRYPLLFPNDITYTIGKSDYHKDWFFEEVPHGTSTAWLNPAASDPANQRFGWVKAESLAEYPQTNQTGPWVKYGRGRATTWTIKFNMDKDETGVATLRVALAGANGFGGLAVGVNGTHVGTIQTINTDAIRYNTDKSVWYEYAQKFSGSLLKAGENQMTLTVPAGELTSGVVYDYLRLELNEDAKP